MVSFDPVNDGGVLSETSGDFSADQSMGTFHLVGDSLTDVVK